VHGKVALQQLGHRLDGQLFFLVDEAVRRDGEEMPQSGFLDEAHLHDPLLIVCKLEFERISGLDGGDVDKVSKLEGDACYFR